MKLFTLLFAVSVVCAVRTDAFQFKPSKGVLVPNYGGYSAVPPYFGTPPYLHSTPTFRWYASPSYLRSADPTQSMPASSLSPADLSTGSRIYSGPAAPSKASIPSNAALAAPSYSISAPPSYYRSSYSARGGPSKPAARPAYSPPAAASYKKSSSALAAPSDSGRSAKSDSAATAPKSAALSYSGPAAPTYSVPAATPSYSKPVASYTAPDEPSATTEDLSDIDLLPAHPTVQDLLDMKAHYSAAGSPYSGPSIPNSNSDALEPENFNDEILAPVYEPTGLRAPPCPNNFLFSCQPKLTPVPCDVSSYKRPKYPFPSFD